MVDSLTRFQAAAELGIGRSQLGRLIDEGALELDDYGITRESVYAEKHRREVRSTVEKLRNKVSIPIAAKLCKVGESRIRYLLMEGRLTGVKMGGMTWIDGDSLIEWIEQQDAHPRSKRNKP